jgi:hypothetical protein
MRKLVIIILSVFGLFPVIHTDAQTGFKNFKVSVYVRAMEVQKMKDQQWLESTWEKISSGLHVDKVYLETHRDLQVVDEETLKKAIAFFKGKGIKVAGGITFTINEMDNFRTFCYSDPVYRKKAKEIVEYTAAHFDEIILDDFFFTNCKCKLCIAAKGDRSWSEYRLELMTEAAQNLIIGPAKKINPAVKVIVKYPNWYDHFQECGFNLETESAIFDGLYTGTETRDALTSDQHLQPYLGYLVSRYYENLKPGKNGGGWVDTYGSPTYDRYAEQLWLTMFAKLPEITFFEYAAMAGPLRKEMIAPWKDQNTSFSYNDFLPLREGGTMAGAASHSLKQIDELVGKLGNPVGIKSYKPFNSEGEYFLQNFFGMTGIPLNLVPEFPMDDKVILLTQQAAKDPAIVQKIETRLSAGKDVVITSGLLNALQDRGIRKIVNFVYTPAKSLVDGFKVGWSPIIKSSHPILIPQLAYFTNDSWEEISGYNNGLGWPVMLRGKYGDANLYVLVIPDNFNDLYSFPDEVLNRIREVLCAPEGIRLAGPAGVSLFLYDNGTFIVESFNDKPVDIQLIMTKKCNSLADLSTNEKVILTTTPAVVFAGKEFVPEMYRCKLTLAPHSFRGFRIE